jgi:hypothetical protein
MSGASYLLLYLPVSFVVFLVLEACRCDDPGRVLRRAAWNFATLGVALLAGGALIYAVNRYF